MPQESDQYTYNVAWLDEDQDYVGLCAEFPSLSHLAVSQEAALRGIRKLIAAVIYDMMCNNEIIPEPIIC
ncbi:MAG: hypothetical protein JW841_15805 [Deltaproteobacteria bacterium]|nr:hypothetical protein [Deltaproteobacteria bacterium]